MPELAAAYAVGFLLNLLFLAFVCWRVYLREKKRTTPLESPYMSHLILGGLCTLLSWGGLIFFVLIETSLLVLAKRERERKSQGYE